MSNVQNGDRLVRDRIKNFEWISNQGHTPTHRTRGQTLTALRHHRDPRDRRANVGLKRGRHRATKGPAALDADFREVSSRARRIHNPHAPRNAAKAASTSSLLASSP